MTDWSQLEHAYGPADDVPALLYAAGPEWASWDELWSRLCHQGTVYSASFAALPALTYKARTWTAAERVPAVILAGAILSSTDRHSIARDPRAGYAAEIAELAELTEQSLREPGLVNDPATYVYLLQALLGVQGTAVWGEQLDGLNDDEFEISCPQCEGENLVAFGADGHFFSNDGMSTNNPASKRLPLLPADPATLTGVARDLHRRTTADGQSVLADKLTYVFGDATCVECGGRFNVAAAVEARWG